MAGTGVGRDGDERIPAIDKVVRRAGRQRELLIVRIAVPLDAADRRSAVTAVGLVDDLLDSRAEVCDQMIVP